MQSMKDTVITARAKRQELGLILGCFVAACLVNVFAIVRYGTHWSELFSQIGYVVCVAAVFYLLVWLVRLVVRLFRRRK